MPNMHPSPHFKRLGSGPPWVYVAVVNGCMSPLYDTALVDSTSSAASSQSRSERML